MEIKKINIVNKKVSITSSITLKESNVFIEPYSTFHRCKRMWNMGSFSYSFSELPISCTVGRYCSIAKNVSEMGFAHPINRFSSSIVTYESFF